MFFLCLLICFAFAWLGMVVADKRGRHIILGALLGFSLGPIGLVILAMLPKRKQYTAAATCESMADYNDLPLVWNENRIDEGEVDRIIAGQTSMPGGRPIDGTP